MKSFGFKKVDFKGTKIMWRSARDPVCKVRVKKTAPYWYKQNGKTFILTAKIADFRKEILN